MSPRVRDTEGRALKVVLTPQEFKRLDALFQAKALIGEIEQGRRLLDKFVADARKNGATWAEVAEATGMAPQSAHSRWSPVSPYGKKVPSARKPRVGVKREVQTSLAV